MIRILIADDHQIVRSGLKALINEQADMKVEGEAANGGEALKLVIASDWRVVLLDIAMPGTNGIDTLHRIKHFKPDTNVLICSGMPESQYAMNLIRSGASGFFSKESPLSELVPAIRLVAKGHKYISEKFTQKLAMDLTNRDGERPLHESLSQREFQVFAKLTSGMSVSEISHLLNLSVKTISTYRSRILEKMRMINNAELTSYAIRNKIVQ